MKDSEVEVILYGKVQKVGLRAYIQARAEELDICGVTRNLDDNSVEVIAQGERKKLGEFVKRIKKGSIFSKIEETDITWHDSSQDSMSDFTIE